MTERYGEETRWKFNEWIKQVTFKLFKYQRFYPFLINKKLNAINVISELEDKFHK